MTGVYLQNKIDEQNAKSGKPDIFKSEDPKVKDIDAAIERARSRKQAEISAQPLPGKSDSGIKNG